jgi:hypothetical protein
MMLFSLLMVLAICLAAGAIARRKGKGPPRREPGAWPLPLRLLLLFLGACFFPLLLLVPLLWESYRNLRYSRYTLVDFLALILLTGQALALIGALFPQETPLWAVVRAALLVGLLPFWGGTHGIRLAHRLGIEAPWQRCLLILRGFLLPPAAIGAVVGLSVPLFVLAGEFSVRWLRNEQLLLAAVVLLWLAALAHVWFYLRLARRAARAPEPKAAPPSDDEA